MIYKELAKKLHKTIIKTFKKRQVHLSFKKVFGVLFQLMQLLSKFNKEIRFLLYVINIFSKYVWVVPLNGKRGITNDDAFQKSLNESGPYRKNNMD